MAIPAQIITAAQAFRANASILAKSLDGLSEQECLASPKPGSNPALWVLGHIVWARSIALKLLGSPWERPWMALFARGAKQPEPSQYPSREELLLAWQEVSDKLTSALETATDDAVSAPVPEKSPSFDGKVSGMLGFLAFHEAYHVGQVSYLRCWLGHDGVVG